jgi:hypothetical protein
MTRLMQYSFYVRMLVEEFILIFMTSLINVMRPSYKTWGEIFSFTLAIILIVTIFSFYLLNIGLNLMSPGNPHFLYLEDKADL